MAATAPSERYAFGDFVLERFQQRVLRNDASVLALSPRLFAALLLFVERAGELVDKDALILALWPGLVVEDNNLSQVISSLRRELGDDPQESRYIQTLPRRGYRFIAAVTALPEEIAAPESAPDVAPDAVAAAQPAAGAPAAVFCLDAAPRPAGLSRRGIAAATVAVALGAGAWWSWRHRSGGSGRPSGAARTTLAVLPFKPLVDHGRDELLEIGMADSLIARLSTLPGLVVRSVGSVRRYAGPDQDPVRAARDLDVAWIIDGSLQRRGDRLRVTARLLSAADGTAAWSGSFDEQVTGVFDVQDAISARVAQVLAPTLRATGGSEHGPVATAGIGASRNADAYQLYLAARIQAQGIRRAGLQKSIDLYHRAIEADPGYALAYAGLVESHRRMLFGADSAPIDAIEPARVAAREALRIAPDLAEAHAGLGWIAFWYDFDWSGAERLFRAALTLNANVVEAHFGIGLLLLTLDRIDEGLLHIRTARELDPVSLILNTLEAAFLLAHGEREAAKLRLQRVFEMEPNFWVGHLTEAGVHLAERRPESALASLRRADVLADGSTQAKALLGVQLARTGRADEARALLATLVAQPSNRYVPPTTIAAIEAALGDTRAALDALERAWTVHDTRLVYMKDDQRWDGLRKELRFIALLRRMRLDAYGPGLCAN